jgi:hypothetical protein
MKDEIITIIIIVSLISIGYYYHDYVDNKQKIIKIAKNGLEKITVDMNKNIIKNTPINTPSSNITIVKNVLNKTMRSNK